MDGRGHDEAQFVREKAVKFQLRLVDRLHMIARSISLRCKIDRADRVARLDGNERLRKASLSCNTGGRMIGRRSCSRRFATGPGPTCQGRRARTGRFAFPENFLGMMKKCLAGLRQRHLFAHPVKKPTANIGFQRLHGVTDGGLREKELLRRDRKLPVRASAAKARNWRLSIGMFEIAIL